MDPLANLAKQRQLATTLVESGDHAPPATDDVVRLAELVLSLDAWRAHGGFDPYARS